MGVRKNNAAIVGVAEAVHTAEREDGKTFKVFQLYVRLMPATSVDDHKVIDPEALRRCIRDTSRAIDSMKGALGVPLHDGPFVVHNDSEVFSNFSQAVDFGSNEELQAKKGQLNGVVRMAAVLLRENGYRVRVMAVEPQQLLLPETDDMSKPAGEEAQPEAPADEPAAQPPAEATA
jgi:hypothetical protein